jgi:hypothetical protein
MSNPNNKQITYLNIVNSTDSTVEGPIPFKVLAENILGLDSDNVGYTLVDFGILNATNDEIDTICSFVFPTTE